MALSGFTVPSIVKSGFSTKAVEQLFQGKCKCEYCMCVSPQLTKRTKSTAGSKTSNMKFTVSKSICYTEGQFHVFDPAIAKTAKL